MMRKRSRKKKVEVEQVEEQVEEPGYVEPYPLTSWMCSRILMKRGFVDALVDDFEATFRECPHKATDADIAPLQQLHVLSKDFLMVLLLNLVWWRRDRLAKSGDLPAIRGAWQP